MNDKKIKKRIQPESTHPITPHQEALFESGKEVLKSSISTGRDFCKYMIGVSSGAIPIYLGLLKIVFGGNIKLDTVKLILYFLPPFLFLISSLIFMFGYFPKMYRFSLDVVDEIKDTLEKIIVQRKKITKIGIMVFVTGNVLGILILTYNILNK